MQQLIRKNWPYLKQEGKKVSFTAVAEEKFATFIARRNKINFAAVAKEKPCPM